MKANKSQYLASVEIYNKDGKSGVINYVLLILVSLLE